MQGRSEGAFEVVGREAERARLLAFLADVRQGRSRALVVRGEAGIGKTILLDDANRAAGALLVLRADAMRADVDLAWSGLRQLLDPLLDAIGALPDPQAAALAVALGLDSAHPGAADRFAVGAAALALLATAAERSAVLAIVDDFQWLDRESADALGFAAGRLEAEGVGLLIGFRDGEQMRPEPPLVEELALEPLDDAAAAALLARATPSMLAPDVARRVLAAAAGNPLAVVELPGVLTADQRAGRRSFEEPLPVASSIRDVFASRLATLTEPARGALTVAAAHQGDDAAVVHAALTRRGLGSDALEPAEDAGLVECREGRVRFVHPLARAAVRDESSAADWRSAHAALAEVFADRGDRESRARHLVAATEHPDEDVASMLEEVAIDARRRGALSVAVELATHAGRLTPDPATGARRRLAAAEVALLAGSLTTVPALLDEIDAVDADERTRARAAHLRGRYLVLAGRPRKAMFILRDGAATIELADPTAAALMLIEGSAAANHSGDVDVGIGMARRACALTSDTSPEGTLAAVALGAALVASGRRDEGQPLLIRYPELLSQPDLLATAVPMLMAVASGLVWLEQFDEAIELVDPFIALARRSGAVGTLPLALLLKGWAHQRVSQTTAAEAALVESLQLAEETGQHAIALQARATLAALYHGQLRGTELRAHAAVVRGSLPHGSAGARNGATMALGGLLLAENRLDEAVEVLAEIADPSDPGAALDNSTHHAAFVNLADAYIRLGRREDAARVAELLGRTGRERGIDWTLGHAERLAGLLAADDAFDAHFEEARRLLWCFPAVRVVVEGGWGERLRAAGRHEEARLHLHTALREARAAGVRWWTDRVVAELRALGEIVAPVEPAASAALTAGELTVAVAFARSRSVPEVAAELFLTPQTVERRLGEAYRKLGAHTAAELAECLAGHRVGETTGVLVRVLGGLAVERDGVPVPAPIGVSGRLLQIVAVGGGRVPVDVVVERLWPDEPAGAGRSRLRNVLTRLRSTCGPVVVREGDVLALADDVVVDAQRFEAETASVGGSGRDGAARAAAALRWYRGDLLPEAAYEPWATGPRERLRQRHLRALDLLVDEAERSEDWHDAVRFLVLGIEAEPYDEDRYLRAAAARLRQERRSSAASFLRRARAVSAELGVTPSPRLAELEAALTD